MKIRITAVDANDGTSIDDLRASTTEDELQSRTEDLLDDLGFDFKFVRISFEEDGE